MAYHYKLNCDDYVLHNGETPIAALLPEVAVVFSFDEEDGIWTRYKTGSPAGMRAWVALHSAKMGADSSLVQSLHILEGKLPVEDLNRAIENGAHLEALLHKCQAIVDTQHLDAGVKRTFKLDGANLEDAPFSLKTLKTPAAEGETVRFDSKSYQADVTDVQVKALRG